MTGDRNIQLDDGNFNERVEGNYIEGDHIETKVPSNAVTNTVIQKTEYVHIYIKGGEHSDTSNLNN